MSLSEALLIDLDELVTQLEERKSEVVAKCDGDLGELLALREQLSAGKGMDEARMKLRAIRHRQFGTDDPKRDKALKAQDMRVRMRAPTDSMGSAPAPKSDKVESAAKAGMSRVVVQGTITRELGAIEGRMIFLLVDEGQTQAAPEVCFLADIRAGLVGLQRELPAHDLLLGLVTEHLDGVEATLRDLAAGGLARAKRFFEHDRELLGRLKAMVRADGNKKSPGALVVEKISSTLQKARKALDGGGADSTKASKELELALMTIHKELDGLGFVAARSLLFSGLRS